MEAPIGLDPLTASLARDLSCTPSRAGGCGDRLSTPRPVQTVQTVRTSRNRVEQVVRGTGGPGERGDTPASLGEFPDASPCTILLADLGVGRASNNIWYGEPIDLQAAFGVAAADDPDALLAAADCVRAAVQALLDQGLAARQGVFQ